MMKKLMPYEYKWIARRLEIYGIKYAEIYNEFYDHMVSAVEGKRAQGDKRPVLVLFQETIQQDFGNKEGLVRIAGERKDLLRSLLRKALKTELRTYFGSWKTLVVAGLVVLVFGLAAIFGLTPYQLAFAAFVLSAAPLLFLVVLGTRQGYFRHVGSRRKKSLVNRLMFSLSLPAYIGVYAGLFLETIAKEVFALPLPGTRLADGIIHSLGVSGCSLLVALVIIYALSFIQVARKDYRQMMRLGAIN